MAELETVWNVSRVTQLVLGKPVKPGSGIIVPASYLKKAKKLLKDVESGKLYIGHMRHRPPRAKLNPMVVMDQWEAEKAVEEPVVEPEPEVEEPVDTPEVPEEEAKDEGYNW